MRRLVYDLLSNHAPLMDLLPGGLYGDRSLDSTPDAKPFGVLMHEGPVPGLSRVTSSRSILWIHDQVGDYTKIDEALKVARDFLTAQTQVQLNGVWLMEARWEGDSVDLFDDVRATNVKNSGYTLIGSGR